MTTGAYTHNGDRDLMRSLGLRTHEFGHDTELGTVVLHEAEERYGAHRPATTVKVKVTALPAQFWHFTVTRPRDEVEELPDGGWRAVYEPVERFEIGTGSGSFSEYWPMVKAVAEHCFEVERVEP